MPEDDLYKDIRIAVVGLYCGGRIDEPDFDDPLNCRHLDDFFSDLVAGKANINLRRALDLEAIVTNLGADGRSVLLIVSSAKDADDSRFMELSESGKLHYCRSTEDAIMQAQSELLASARDLVLVSHLPDDASEPVFAIALARYADGLASPVYAILSGAGFQSTALSSVERLHSGESEQSVSFGSLSSNSDVAIALFAGQLEGDGGICCGLRKLSKSDSIASLFETVCSLHAKILIGGEHVEQMLSNSRLFCLETIRPWIHPVYQESRPRRAALILDCIETDSFFVLALAEADGATTAVAPSFRLPWASEVVLFSGESQEELLENVKLIESLIELYPGIDLASLAYTLSCFFEPEINSWRLSLVASSMDALSGKLQVVSEKLVSGVDYLADQKDGIFLTSPDTAKQGDLAFLLPGLGSAYTNMLSDLCMHFSQVREVFDFVDRVTEKLGASEAPSLRIFPVLVESDRTNANPVASLASADYAVVAVLMTEHAIFNLLGRIGIIPDVLLGFSTGEFGVYTMNGCIDVVEAAPLFYHLSTSAARSIDEKKVESLRTVSVFTDRKSVMDLVERLNLEIFLTVDLAAGHVIVTGEKAQVLRLLEELSDAEINYHVLPLSIPYHTNLVEGVLADNLADDVLGSITFDRCLIPAWLCSLANRAPDDASRILDTLTGLLRRPILFRQTIESMYENGVRFFVEVGPQGVLTSQVRDILGKYEVVAVASNLSRRDGITQINFLIAELFSHGKPLNLAYLYEHRAVAPVAMLVPGDTATGMEDCYSQQKAASLIEPTCASANELEEEILTSYFNTLTDLHDQVNNASMEIIKTYFENIAAYENGEGSDPSLAKVEGKTCFLIRHKDLPQKGTAITLVDQKRVLKVSPNWTDAFFSAFELQEVEALFRNEKRKREWLLGRLAAKEAVLALLSDSDPDMDLDYADVDILTSDLGPPRVEVKGALASPLVSIAHSGDTACAVAVMPGRKTRPGIDIEPLGQVDDGMGELVLSRQERESVEACFDPDLAFLSLWTAKEAAYKAFGGDGIRQFQAEPNQSLMGEISLLSGENRIKVLSLQVFDHILAVVLS